MTADEVAQIERDKTGGNETDKAEEPVSTKTATGATKRKSEGGSGTASKKSKRAAVTPEDDEDDDE